MKSLQKFSKLIVIAVVIVLSGLTLGFKSNAHPSKITVCHMPPGNVENCQEISVSMNALQAHLDHGDDLVCHDENELETYIKIYTQFIVAQQFAPNALITSF